MRWRTARATPVVRFGAARPLVLTVSFPALKRTGSLGHKPPPAQKRQRPTQGLLCDSQALRLRRATKATTPRPAINMAYVVGSGTGAAVKATCTVGP